MEEFFMEQDANVPQITQYQPPQPPNYTNQTQPTLAFESSANQSAGFEFTAQSGLTPQSTFTYPETTENEFDQFEQDETTKRIRQEEERLLSALRDKSQKEWQEKSERVAQGRKQLEDFIAKKEQEKRERAEQNQQKEDKLRQEYNKLKGQQGWPKVIAAINLRQGEHQGKKDINRMREAILHRREDQSPR